MHVPGKGIECGISSHTLLAIDPIVARGRLRNPVCAAHKVALGLCQEQSRAGVHWPYVTTCHCFVDSRGRDAEAFARKQGKMRGKLELFPVRRQFRERWGMQGTRLHTIDHTCSRHCAQNQPQDINMHRYVYRIATTKLLVNIQTSHDIGDMAD